ncbi:hypothetical protein EB796_008150 [Bugula neritina]|uniref:NHL repeat protein n=1 Tax=Bugula neritina TaxID=10212 RepID=A0A7J7K5Q6_BUGNE|nr:hypothetical protein EB796_008150 [Bugula neritina]
MKQFAKVKNSDPSFRYIGRDAYIKGQYLLVYGYGIYTTPDFTRAYYVSGNKKLKGYREGPQRYARYGHITGIVTNSTSSRHIWIADLGNNCIRTVNRTDHTSKELVGACEHPSVKDGIFGVARIAYPFEMAISPLEKKKVYFFERVAETLRCLERVGLTWQVRTVLYLRQKIYGMNFDPNGDYMYFSTKSSIIRASSTWSTPAVDLISGTGHNDGALDSAKVQEASSMLFLNNDTFLFADSNNHVIRVVDLSSSSVSTVCIPQTSDAEFLTGSISTCKFIAPRYLYKFKDSWKVFIIGDHTVYELKYTGESKLSSLNDAFG